MSLKPIFQGEPQAETVRTIDGNLASIAGQLFSTQSLLDSERVRLLEIAVSIQDAESRGAFVSLINNWVYLAKQAIQSHDQIGIVRRQFQSKFGAAE